MMCVWKYVPTSVFSFQIRLYGSSQPLTVGDLRPDPLRVFEAKPGAAVGDPLLFGQEEAKAISITITGQFSHMHVHTLCTTI